MVAEINSRRVGDSEVLPETGFGSLAFFVDDHTERGAGGREYGTSEKDEQTLTG
jgi:hypothetical protein